MSDFMLAGHILEDKKVLSVYINQYDVQNVRELPGVFEIGSLGFVWFTKMWEGDRPKLWVDSDPSWMSGINQIADKIYEHEIDLVLFYNP